MLYEVITRVEGEAVSGDGTSECFPEPDRSQRWYSRYGAIEWHVRATWRIHRREDGPDTRLKEAPLEAEVRRIVWKSAI